MTNLESSFLAADYKKNNKSLIKLWSETNATVTPLYLAKKSIFFLRQFRWYEAFRPKNPEDIFNFPTELLDLFDDARRSAGGPVPVRSTGADSTDSETAIESGSNDENDTTTTAN